MTQLNQLTQQNASSSEELAATAEEMSSHAQNLQQLVGFFKVEGTDAQAVQAPAPVRRTAVPVREVSAHEPALTHAGAHAAVRVAAKKAGAGEEFVKF
jgi:methyl-accepting chemotaxis protein